MAALTKITYDSHLNFLQRLTLLVYHYLSGPLIGVRLKVMVYDYCYKDPDQLVACGMLGLLFTVIAYDGTATAIRFGLLAMLLPVLVYAFVPIAQTVLEYRSYLSAFGTALILAYLISLRPTVLMPVGLALVTFYFIMSRRRIKLFTDPRLFWHQAAEDHIGLAGSTYLFEMHCQNRFQGLDRVVHLLLNDNLPQTAGEWLNVNQWAELDQKRIKEAASFLTQAVFYSPNSSAMWRNLGVVRYYLSQDRDGNRYRQQLIDSMNSFSRAVELDPTDALSWLGLGQCRIDLDDLKYAALCFKSSLDLAPDSVYTRIQYLKLLEQTTDVSEFQRIDQYFKDRNTIYVTPGMLPDELQSKYEEIIHAQRTTRPTD